MEFWVFLKLWRTAQVIAVLERNPLPLNLRSPSRLLQVGYLFALH